MDLCLVTEAYTNENLFLALQWLAGLDGLMVTGIQYQFSAEFGYTSNQL
jgi:hypothetical protein